MLTPLNEMLAQAEQGNYAVIAPDFSSLLIVTALIELAETHQAPLLISYAPVLKQCRDLKNYAQFIQVVLDAGRAASVPIGLHLDHGSTLDEIREAIDVGFTSVMMDASLESWDVNVARTQEAVTLARAAGVHVEAELGHVAVGDKYISQADKSDNVTHFTNPDQAAKFVELTGVDALAVSVGTIHGSYRGEPNLQFDLLRKLQTQVPVPLVLHGGSGTGADNIQQAVTLGIRKINVFSDLVRGVREEIKTAVSDETTGPIELANAQRRAVNRVITPYLQMSRSVGKA